MHRFALVAAALITTTAHASVLDADGLPIEADWVQVDANTYEASGTVVVAGVTLDGAEVLWDDGIVTGVVTEGIGFGDGCRVRTGETWFGIAPGSLILEDVSDAPVQADETYLYFDADDTQTLSCNGLEATLVEGNAQEFYLNPLDPSIYVTASGFEMPADDAYPLSVDSVTIGVSEQGLIPWTSSVKDKHGDFPTMNAHQVLGGTFEVDVQGIPFLVEDGTSAWRWKDDGSLADVCFSGQLLISGYEFPVLGSVDLPLGEGVACKDSTKIVFHADMEMDAWKDLDLPRDLENLIDDMAGKSVTINGSVNLSNGNFKLEIERNWPLYGGLLDVDGTFKLTHEELTIDGTSKVDVGDLKFGRVDVGVTFKDSGKMKAKASGKATIPGTGGKKIEADFAWDRDGLDADAVANLWGFKLKGAFAFDGFKFQKTTLSTGFDISIASGKVKLILKPSSVDVRVEGEALGAHFDLGVNSRGCFEVAGSEICL